MELSLYFSLELCIAIFTVVLLLFATLWHYLFVYRPLANFPSVRLDIRILYWILSGRKVDRELFKKGIELPQKYKDEGLFVVWLFFKPLVIVCGGEIAKPILSHSTDKIEEYRIFEYTFGKGIFVSKGERYKNYKKKISPAFHTNVLMTFVPFMNGYAKALVERLTEKNGQEIADVSHVMGEFTLRLFYETSLGVEIGDSKEVERTIKIMEKMTEFITYRTVRIWLHYDFLLPLFPYARQMLKLEAENRKSIIQSIEQIKKSITARQQSPESEEDSDFLSPRAKSLGEILIEEFPSYSMDELARETNSTIFAGYDTTAHMLMWTFYSLGLHPEIQQRVYEEIATVTEEIIQPEHVRDLTYLDCVIKESLRLYPIPMTGRRVKKDLQCGNYLIPKNTDVIFNLFMLHRNPDVYPDPWEFYPERFTDKNSKIKSWNYIPFMEGVRPCLGKNYAMLTMKIFVIHVLRHFKVVSRKEDLTFKYLIVLSAEEEPRIKFIPRHERTYTPEL